MTRMLKNWIVLLSIVFGLAVAPQQAHAIERQRAMNWCWASAIQDLYRMAGGSIEQLQVAAMLDGWPQDRPAQIGEVVALLRRLGIPASAGTGALSPEALGQVLATGHRVIAFVSPTGGSVGHYIVIEGYDQYRNLLVVADPWTGQTGYQTIGDLYYSWHWLATVIAG